MTDTPQTEPETPTTSKYRMRTEIFKDDERIVSVGDSVEAPSFVEAMPALNIELNAQWMKVAELAQMIEEQ